MRCGDPDLDPDEDDEDEGDESAGRERDGGFEGDEGGDAVRENKRPREVNWLNVGRTSCGSASSVRWATSWMRDSSVGRGSSVRTRPGWLWGCIWLDVSVKLCKEGVEGAYDDWSAAVC